MSSERTTQTAREKKHQKKAAQDPYLWARRQWDLQAGRANKTLIFWRILAVIGLGGWVVTGALALNHMSQPKLLPYIVTIRGEEDVEFRGMAQPGIPQLTDAITRNYLMRFIRNIRTISSDTVVTRTSIQDAYAIATTTAQRQLNTYFQAMDPGPFQLLNDGFRRDLRFNVFEQITENTWRVEWVEEIRRYGNLRQTVRQSGTFSFVSHIPDTPQAASINPMGFYISEFFIAERMQ